MAHAKINKLRPLRAIPAHYYPKKSSIQPPYLLLSCPSTNL